MDRRRLGLLLLVIAVTAALVVPALAGHNVAGSAAAGPVDPAPAVGACIRDPIPGDTTTYTADGSLVYPTMIMAPCTGPRFGEVAGIIGKPVPPPHVSATPQGPESPASTQTYTFTIESDANLATCDTIVRRYVGLGLAGAVGNPAAKYYTIDDPVNLTLMAPSVRQQANGQHWLACIAMISVPGDKSPYADPLANVLTGHRVPDQLGNCASRLVALQLSAATACGDDHVVEYFGSATTPQVGVTQDQLTQACRTLVQQRTGMTDVTAGGRLQVLAYAQHEGEGGEPINGYDQLHAGTIDCLVHSSSGRPWKHTLLGHGNAAIDWD